MMMHPSVMQDLAHDRHHELIAEAEQNRLLSMARTARRARKARASR